MTTTALATALTDCAAGLYPLEASVALFIAEGTFLNRDDFTSRFIEHGTSGGTPMAAIDRDAAIIALNAGELPCSAGERRILAAVVSIVAGITADLRDTATGLDTRNIQRLVTGSWSHGFTAQGNAAASLDPEESRHFTIWDKPAEICPGWTRAVRLIIPDGSRPGETRNRDSDEARD